jgi:hypothetical protein
VRRRVRGASAASTPRQMLAFLLQHGSTLIVLGLFMDTALSRDSSDSHNVNES